MSDDPNVSVWGELAALAFTVGLALLWAWTAGK